MTTNNYHAPAYEVMEHPDEFIELRSPIGGTTLLTGKPYTPAAKTDITKTWRKFGWTPPSQAWGTGQ